MTVSRTRGAGDHRVHHPVDLTPFLTALYQQMPLENVGTLFTPDTILQYPLHLALDFPTWKVIIYVTFRVGKSAREYSPRASNETEIENARDI
jgi:hypothetical protein